MTTSGARRTAPIVVLALAVPPGAALVAGTVTILAAPGVTAARRTP